MLVDGHDLLRSHQRLAPRPDGQRAAEQLPLRRLGAATTSASRAPTRPKPTCARRCESLDCLDLIEALPRGLETQVGEKSAALSLGQRQLICFARALLADPRIVVLDEATSAIDSVTEARLQRALEILLRGRTAFVVAHRLSTIRKADLVLVLDQGRIVERGTHAEPAGSRRRLCPAA